MTPCANACLGAGSCSRRALLATFGGLCVWSLSPAVAGAATSPLVKANTPPEFSRWPPHRPTALHFLRRDHVGGRERLATNAALETIEDRLSELKYPPHFFRIHDGVALATPFERIHEDGRIWREERFRPDKHLMYHTWFGEKIYPRRARAFVFFVSAGRIPQGKSPTDYRKHQLALTAGIPFLGPGMELPELTPQHRITAYVYEYGDDTNGVLTFVEESKLDGRRHLQQAGIIA